MAGPETFRFKPEFGEEGKITASPYHLLVTGEDNLRVSSFGSLASIVIQVVVRFWDHSGEIKTHVIDHVPNSDRTEATTSRRLGNGFILGLYVRISSGSPIVGQDYVRIQIIRGLTGATLPINTIVQGYVADGVDLSWPPAVMHRPTQGEGAIRSITGTDPAAGVETSETVPTGVRWRLLSWIAELVTDATVANRNPRIEIDNGTTNYYETFGPSDQTASLTRRYQMADYGFDYSGQVRPRELHLPSNGILLLPGDRIRTSTIGFQAGDDWGPPELRVEEWLEP